MSRRLAYMILHTGAPYLRYAVQSILPQVDKLMIFYSEKPSQGYQTDILCPDTREQLKALAGPDVIWIDGKWNNETDHVNAVRAYTDKYDWLVRLDADEIYPPGMVDEMIRQAEDTDHTRFRVPFVHFWRCFHRVCRDGSHPHRLERLRAGDGTEKTLDSKDWTWMVYHFGYAMPTKYIEYKMEISGHRPEWRSNWFKERWLANAQRDVHPVMFPHHWHAEDFDKTKLPEIMHTHPYFSKAIID